MRTGKIVIPVLVTPGAGRPLYLSHLNYRKYPEQQTEILADLHASSPAVALPRQLSFEHHYDTIPPLPRNFIPREQTIACLRNLLLEETSDSQIAITAVAGMGGIGKTVLATVLCRDQAVQYAFPDCIAWVILGHEWNGDLVAVLQKIAKALGGDLSQHSDPIICQNHYQDFIRDKAALVVIDDVWNHRHLTPFDIDAPRARLLFTTRDDGIANAAASRKFTADTLTQPEARDLLARAAGLTVAKLPDEADRVITECNGLAAALAQIGASLRNRAQTWWATTLYALQNADVSAVEAQLPSGQ